MAVECSSYHTDTEISIIYKLCKSFRFELMQIAQRFSLLV